jgi:hypothetical protein
VVEDFQRKILGAFFDGCRETIVVVGKGNGKSSFPPAPPCVVARSGRSAAVSAAPLRLVPDD